MFLQSFINQLRQWKRRIFTSFYRALYPLEYKQLRKDHENIHGNGGLFVIPCDLWSLIGSRGDEAMLMVLQQRFPDMPYYIATALPEADKVAKDHGWIPVRCWLERHLYQEVYNAAKKIKPSYCVLLGADVMDGYYSWRFSQNMFRLADIMESHGVPTSIMGFSFNASPHPKVIDAVQEIENQNLEYHLRDAVSLERFERITGKKAVLTADIAFLLKPDCNSPQYSMVRDWKQNRKLLAINLHPMLIKNATEEQVNALIDVMYGVISKLLTMSDWNILLLPHDNRKKIGDNVCLEKLYNRFDTEMADRLKYIPEVLDAAKVKGVVGLADALITSRMHLGIGGLSQAVPTMGFAYQDKFQGLLQHMNLDDKFIMPALVTENMDQICEKILWLQENHCELKQQIESSLGTVKALAEKNLQCLNIKAE